jgi:hypothetical protein
VGLWTFRNYRMPALDVCAQSNEHLLLQKPESTNLESASQTIVLVREAALQQNTQSLPTEK